MKTLQASIRNHTEFIDAVLIDGQTQLEITGKVYEDPINEHGEPDIHSLIGIVDGTTKYLVGHRLYPKRMTQAELEAEIRNIKEDVLSYVEDQFKPVV